MKTCRRGHQFRGDENYRAKRGWCPVCFNEVQRRYAATEKAKAKLRKYAATDKSKAAHSRYNDSAKGQSRSERYRQSPQGWLQALEERRHKALNRRKQRQEAEDFNG